MEWFKNIWNPKSLVVVFLQFEGDAMIFSALKYKGLRDDISTENEAMRFDSFDEIVKHFGKSVPYHIQVSGKGVLSRKIKNGSGAIESLVISGNVEDFYFTSYSDEMNIVASFFRKSLLDEVLLLADALKLHLLGITSGLVPLFSLDDDFKLNLEYSIQKQDGKILDFTKSEESKKYFSWNDKQVSKEQLIAYAIYNQLAVSNDGYETSEQESYELKRENYRQYTQFKVLGLSLLGIIFLALTINYIYQGSLNNQIAGLEADLSVSNQSLSLLDQLEQEKQRKEQLVFNAGVNSSKFLAFYLDEIGRTVPGKIYLTDLELFPLESKLKNKHKVEVKKKNIRISGNTPENTILDDWIERMNRFAWIKAIQLLNYSKTEHGNADFMLSLTIEN